jgi:hypothetical protein
MFSDFVYVSCMENGVFLDIIYDFADDLGRGKGKYLNDDNTF